MADPVKAATDINTWGDWFQGALAADPLPTEHLVAALQMLQKDGRAAEGAEYAARLLDAVTARNDLAAVIRVLTLQASLVADPHAYRGVARDRLARLLPERRHTAILESIGLDAAIPVAEALRRLQTLLGLKEGAFCLDKTWGFGVVKRVDEFYKKVTIDFARKPGHQMTFAYAGEALQLVGDDHLLAVKHRRPADLRALVDSRPDELVRLALRSYGPLTIVQLQELLGGEGLDGGDWKGFWDRARKLLKQEGLVDIPGKRTEPLRLRGAVKQYDADWFAGVQKERDPRTILDLVVELEKAGEVRNLTSANRQLLAERLAFAVRGTEDKQSELAARLVMAAERLGLADAGFDIAGAFRRLAEPQRLGKCLTLPARDVEILLPLLNRDVADLAQALIAVLPTLPVHAVHVVLDDLRAAGAAGPVSRLICAGMAARTATPEVLDYICEHRNLLVEWQLGGLGDLLRQVIGALETPASGERYRTQKQLRERFEDREWLEAVLGALEARERTQLLTRIRQSRGWDESSKRSLMGRLIKMHPELEIVLAKGEKGAAEPKEQRFTSWRSYHERQEQLRVLVEVTIPQNSKDIAHARSYGDLRENFEYQAAKDQQRLLLRREAEIKADLAEVRGTDFAGIGADKVSMGTGVRLQRPGGAEEFYWVLGEWDRDEALAIISNRSELAKRLEGATVGAEIAMPGDGDGLRSRVVEIVGLSEPIRTWVRGNA